MKKIAIILLLFVYGFTTVGATVDVHYCMNKYVGWELGDHNEDEKCGKCGMTESKTKNGCCKDEVKQVKLNGDYQKSAINNLAKVNLATYIILTTEDYSFLKPENIVLKKEHIYPPPNITTLDLVILYNNIRI